MSERPILEIAEEEILSEFLENCATPVKPAAEAHFMKFVDHAILELLRDREIEWDGRARKFSRSFAAGMARAMDKEAKKNETEVTKDLADYIMRRDLEFWENICPLPPAEPLRAGCTRGREMLGMAARSAKDVKSPRTPRRSK